MKKENLSTAVLYYKDSFILNTVFFPKNQL